MKSQYSTKPSEVYLSPWLQTKDQYDVTIRTTAAQTFYFQIQIYPVQTTGTILCQQSKIPGAVEED